MPGIVVNPTTQPVPVQPNATPAAATGATPAVRPSTPGVQPPGTPNPTGQHNVQQAGANRSGRYAPVRSPEVLGSFKPKSEPASPASGNIFGDSLMSEKSLDEVILAYLADDLDDKKR
jgi:hypothetical protein